MHLYQYTLHTTNSRQWHLCIYISHLLILYPHTTSYKKRVLSLSHMCTHIQQQLNQALSQHMPLSHSHTPNILHSHTHSLNPFTPHQRVVYTRPVVANGEKWSPFRSVHHSPEQTLPILCLDTGQLCEYTGRWRCSTHIHTPNSIS